MKNKSNGFKSTDFMPPAVQQSRSASSASRNHSAAKPGTTRKQTGLQISKINDPNNRKLVGARSQGEAVIRAAILLDRLKFSPGEISTGYDNNLAKATRAFQSATGLPSTGNLDSATWSVLNDNQKGSDVPARE